MEKPTGMHKSMAVNRATLVVDHGELEKLVLDDATLHHGGRGAPAPPVASTQGRGRPAARREDDEAGSSGGPQREPVGGARSARIWVVEDDDHIRDSLEVSLKEEGYQLRVDPDGRRVKRVVKEFRPQLTVLEVDQRVGPTGCAIARVLKGSGGVAVLFLTGADSLDDRLAGFHAGADDYLVKPFWMAELLARVRALLRRTGHTTSSLRQVGDLTIDESAYLVSRAGSCLDLTRTEYDLLLALARQPGSVVSKSQLLAQIWPGASAHSNVVEVHVCALRRKLEAHGPRIVHTEYGFGYTLRG